MLTRTFLRGLFVVFPELQFAIDPFALQLLFEDAECLIHVVVAYDDLHAGFLEMSLFAEDAVRSRVQGASSQDLMRRIRAYD
jgi:hypothetical protein